MAIKQAVLLANKLGLKKRMSVNALAAVFACSLTIYR